MPGANGSGKGTLMISTQCQAWASSNGHAAKLAAAKELVQEWRRFRGVNASSYQAMTPDQLEALKLRYDARLQRISDALLVKTGA